MKDFSYKPIKSVVCYQNTCKCYYLLSQILQIQGPYVVNENLKGFGNNALVYQTILHQHINVYYGAQGEKF
jgi:hypothetical protein